MESGRRPSVHSSQAFVVLHTRQFVSAQAEKSDDCHCNVGEDVYCPVIFNVTIYLTRGIVEINGNTKLFCKLWKTFIG